MQHFYCIGNLTKDPTLQETKSGIAFCRFTVAVQRKFADASGNKATDFFDCTAWRGLAETISKYCKKGNKVAVSGSLQLNKWEDDNGTNRISIDVQVSDIEFLTPKAQGETEARPPISKLQNVQEDMDLPF